MKKITALMLTGLFAFAGAAMFSSCKNSDKISLYFVPGTYMEDGVKTENTVPSGAEALTQKQCKKIKSENVYRCTLAEGEALPVPVSSRKDAEGNPYTFNGWWTIVDATVTYFETVPELTETIYLYADWRADLSQPQDPVEPDDSVTVQPKYYMSVLRAETQETESVPLRVWGTDVTNAETLGYGAPVQLHNDWFVLNPGDEVSVYTAGLLGSEEAQLAPVSASGGSTTITLENSDAEGNDTKDYLEKSSDTALLYKKTLSARHFRIYIKFYDKGATMTVYMQPMD